jgi:ubiquinone/menaquinone biosynthesis C-methylase UbiE
MMNYDPGQTARYFDLFSLGEWDRLVRSPLEEIKLHIHNHYLKTYLRPGSRVLEIGAGPGRFTQTLHFLECRVLVTDLSQVQLDLNRQKAAELGFASAVEGWIQLDVCEMRAIESASFDALVCYGGPFSYVFEHADRAVQECARVLKPSGLLFSSAMSFWGTAHAFFGSVLEIPLELNRVIFQTGDLTPETQPGSAHYCHLFSSDEYRLLHERNGLEVLRMSASNAVSTGWADTLDRCRSDPSLWSFILELELQACAADGFLDGGTHILAVARKP